MDGLLFFLMKKFVIYKIENQLSQVYIGKTTNLKLRIRGHKYKNGYKKSELVESIKMYGWDNHKVTILEEFIGDDGMADCKEIFWIRTYMSNKNKWPEMNGFNLTNGGSGCYGHIGAFKGQKRSKEVGMAISKGRFKKINQYDKCGNLIAQYESGLEAAKILGVTNRAISKTVTGINLTCKGFILKYA